jgi:hypothetical protein
MNISYGSRESTDESALLDIDISSSCKHVFSAINYHCIHVVKRALRGERRVGERRVGERRVGERTLQVVLIASFLKN